MWKVGRGQVAGVLGVMLILGAVACAPAASPLAQRGAESGRKSPEEAASRPVEAPKPVDSNAGAPAARPEPARAVSADAAQSTAPWDRMVIRTVNLGLQVENVERAIAQVREIAQAGGGFVSTSNTRFEKVNDQDRMVADLTIQVRSDTLDRTVQALRQLAIKVESETGTSQDVTEEYVDLDSELRNFQATEAAIVRLMDKAQRIEDVLALQRELTNVRGNIERIQGRKRYLERRSEMATISLALRLPPTPQSSTWDPLRVAQRGWEASLSVVRGVAELLIMAAAFSWWLVPFLALGAYALKYYRTARRTPRPSAPEA